MSSALLDGLNDAQRVAVTAPDGPVLILAGPGSGKTRVLTRRLAYLIEEQGVPPWQIVAVTFTNKAAREIRHRVDTATGESLGEAMIGTFHAICARLLRIEADQHLPLSSDYVIFDASDQIALMKTVLTEDMNLDPKKYPPRRMLNSVSRAKNNLITPAEYRAESYFEELAGRAYERYQEHLTRNNAVDFDDLLIHMALLLRDNDAVRHKYQRRFTHILVDEFQDTNMTQYELVKLLAAPQNNLFCVGVEDQSIYRWRGADYRNVRRLREDYPTIQTILLEQNYRSTQTILDASVAVIDGNPHRTQKGLFTEAGQGEQILIYEAQEESDEAQFIVDTIAQLVKASEVEPGECAIMYRTNAQSRVLEETFVRAGLPYRLVGGTRFYSRREIKDLLAYLRIIHNPDDQVSLLRAINTPTRGIGAKTLEGLEQRAERSNLTLYGALRRIADDPDHTPFGGRALNALGGFMELLDGWRSVAEETPLHQLLRLIIDEVGYYDYIVDGTEQGDDRWDNVEELLELVTEFQTVPLQDFLTEVALVADVDDLPTSPNAPTLMTLHAAKGLEFDVVFITGLEEGVLPHKRSEDEPEALQEERRLLYVGMTRALKRLYLLYTFKRMVFGERLLNTPSRFLEAIPDDLLVTPRSGYRRSGYRRATTWSSAPPRTDEVTLQFRAGQRVSHPQFGEGIVMQTIDRGTDTELTIVFEDVGPKRLMVRYANLTLLEG
ncbi:MAG: ATP-dependent helicase [Anaerolineae bacterium]